MYSIPEPQMVSLHHALRACSTWHLTDDNVLPPAPFITEIVYSIISRPRWIRYAICITRSGRPPGNSQPHASSVFRRQMAPVVIAIPFGVICLMGIFEMINGCCCIVSHWVAGYSEMKSLFKYIPMFRNKFLPVVPFTRIYFRRKSWVTHSLVSSFELTQRTL